MKVGSSIAMGVSRMPRFFTVYSSIVWSVQWDGDISWAWSNTISYCWAFDEFTRCVHSFVEIVIVQVLKALLSTALWMDKKSFRVRPRALQTRWSRSVFPCQVIIRVPSPQFSNWIFEIFLRNEIDRKSRSKRDENTRNKPPFQFNKGSYG